MARTSARNRFPVYVAAILVPMVLLGCCLMFNIMTLDRVGEYANIDDIVGEQRAEEGLYNGLVHSMRDYKLAGYRHARPDITVIGSSRSLQVRDYFFKQRFFNAGGIVYGPTDAFHVTDRLRALHEPGHLIWFLDFFHFCAGGNEFRTDLVRPPRQSMQQASEIQRALVPIRLIAVQKIIGLKDFLSWGLGGATRDFNGVRLYGLGLQNGLASAFGGDGSLYKDLDGQLPDVESRMESGLREIDAATPVWRPDCWINQESLQLVDLFVNEMAAAGIKLTMIAAPLPRRMLDHMRRLGRYRYIDEWRRLMRKRYANFYDYLSVDQLQGTDCEFIDYYHGGEVTYMRILMDIARKPGAAIANVVDSDRLKNLVAKNAGDVVVADNNIGRAITRPSNPGQGCNP